MLTRDACLSLPSSHSVTLTWLSHQHQPPGSITGLWRPHPPRYEDLPCIFLRALTGEIQPYSQEPQARQALQIQIQIQIQT